MNRTVQRSVNVLRIYGERLSAFQPNARLYLTAQILTGAAMGVYRLLFNFYILSLGYDEALLGMLVTTNNLTALLAALPMGYLADALGRKKALVLGSLFQCLSVLGIVLAPQVGVLIAANVVSGVAQGLIGATGGPFLMENSSEKERTYLFSFAQGMQMTSVFVGNWVGGYLPTWMASRQTVLPTSPEAYGASLAVVVVGMGLAAVPYLLIRAPKPTSSRSSFASPAYFVQERVLLGRLIAPLLATSLGAGMIMPFMNVFFRQVHNQSDPAIGTLFAWGSLAMGVGLMIAPPLAERYGKIELVVVSQALSIPFLVVLGYGPFALSAGSYFVRLALMNMSGPVYQTFVMEKVAPERRATVASLTSMAFNFGWAFSPSISGWLQVNYGFGPAFACTIALYVLSTFLYWQFFWRGRAAQQPAVNPA
jgi:MFS family permease